MGSNFFWENLVTNGVRQGRVLPPLLFNVDVDELSECQNKSSTGRSINDTIINPPMT